MKGLGMEGLIIIFGHNGVQMRDVRPLWHILEHRILEHRIKMKAKKGDLQESRC